jgi:hypothetical protein
MMHLLMILARERDPEIPNKTPWYISNEIPIFFL